MKHCFSFLFFLFVGCLPSSAQQVYPAPVEEKIRQVEEHLGLVKFRVEGMKDFTIADRMAHYHIKGLSIAVVHHYKIEWAKGYGWADSAERRPVTPETLFQPGSISKSLNALGVLKLVQDKKIDPDADINTYLRRWKFPYDSVSHNKKITVTHLLSHTGGLGVHGFPGYLKGDTLPTLPQVLDGLPPANTAPVRAVFEPGLKFSYSGGGTVISELMAMDVTGLPYDEYMARQVFEPIGMSSSFFTQPPPAAKWQRLATGYTSLGKEVKGKYPILIEQAAGGLWTTPGDLCRYIIEMQLSLKGKSNKVLSQAMTKKMLSPYLDEGNGLGVFVEDHNGNKYFQHAAGNQGFSGQYYGSFKDGNGVAIVVNSDDGQGLIQELVQQVAQVYKWPGFYRKEEPVIKKTIVVPDSLMDIYAGAYRQNDAITTISRNGHQLYYQAGPKAWSMYFTSDSTFMNLESLSEKTFYKNAGGSVGGFSRRANGKDYGKAEKITLITLPDSLLEKYAGTYLDERRPVSIIKKGSELWFDPGFDQALLKLNFISLIDFYYVNDFGSEFRFVLNQGRVEGVYTKSGRYEKMIPRKP